MSQYVNGNGFKNTDQKENFNQEKKIDEFIIDETLIRIGSQYVWLWVAIEPKNKQILQVDMSFERTMLVTGRFIASLINTYGKQASCFTDGGTWYRMACKFLRLRHHLHSPFDKSLIERTMQYIKDRTESFDDYFPCRKKKGCNFLNIKNWLGLFATMHNKEMLDA